ncbi:MAG: hypothetical protein ACN6OB_00495 [Chryseobacterium jejuense]|uniref:hypothetical protein n=1 Tax=Chryseobacterium jejuense TaxID=445960 RepID=UPI003D0B96BF
MDKPNENRIKNLHPLIRKEITQIVKECDEALIGGAKVRITQWLIFFRNLLHFERSFIWKGERKIKASWRNLQNLPKDKDGYVIFTQ